MPNYASITLIGHVGKAEDLKYTPQGTAVLRFSLAVNTGFGDRKTVNWYSCQLWAKQAEALAPYIAKGKPLQVVGEPTIRQYTTADGKQGTSIDVRVRDLTLLGGRDDHAQEPQQGQPPADAANDADGVDIPF
jgi:single-strand DNA-binding protein